MKQKPRQEQQRRGMDSGLALGAECRRPAAAAGGSGLLLSPVLSEAPTYRLKLHL